MRADELLTAITFRRWARTSAGFSLKLGLRRAQAISVVDAAVVLRFEGATVADAVIALGSVAPTIYEAAVAQRSLVGRELTPESIREAARLAAAAVSPIDDVRGTAEYRSEMVRVLVGRALKALAENDEAVHYPENPAMLWGAKHGAVGTPLKEALQHSEGPGFTTTINGQTLTVMSGQDEDAAAVSARGRAPAGDEGRLRRGRVRRVYGVSGWRGGDGVYGGRAARPWRGDRDSRGLAGRG